MTCRTCKHLLVRPDADGKVRIRKDRAYPCRCPIPIVPMPRSVKGYSISRIKVVPGYMEPDDGDNCFYHTERTK